MKINVALYSAIRKACFIACVIPLNTFANPTISLHDVLEAALEIQHQSNSNVTRNPNDKPQNSWLASSPTVSMLHLRGPDRTASKETELSINFAIKSSLQRQLDQTLQNSIPVVKKQITKQKALLLSGLIRQVIWDIKLHDVYIEQSEQKQSLLRQLQDRFKAIASAGSSPNYLYLLIQQEYLQAELSRIEHVQTHQSLLSYYTELTGLHALPVTISETPSDLSAMQSSQHPDIAVLDTNWQIYLTQVQSASNKTQPWNLALTAKRISNADMSENQLGVSVELPIGMGNDLNQAQYNQMIVDQEQYMLERDSRLQHINLSIHNAKKQLELFEQKSALLEQSVQLSEKIKPTLKRLLDANTFDQEWLLRRLIELIDHQTQYAQNKINIQKQISLLNQAAGISL